MDKGGHHKNPTTGQFILSARYLALKHPLPLQKNAGRNTNKCYASDNYVESLYQGVVLVFTLCQWKVRVTKVDMCLCKISILCLMMEFDAEWSGGMIER